MPCRILPSFRPRRTLYFAGLIGLLLLIATTGCRSDRLSDSEEETLRDIFRSGLEMDLDPFVRAETLRAIDLAGDSDLMIPAQPLLRDREPVVRAAALRTLLRSDHLDSPYRSCLHAFNQSRTEAERYQIVELCLRYGDERARQTMIERALRDESARLRLRALEGGLLRQIDEAREAGDDDHLRRELIPALGDYVDDDAPEIAATALRALIDAGRHNRADQFIEQLRDESTDIEERITAARILVRARVEDAEDAFRDILDNVGAYDPDELGIPDQPIDERLLRLAVLGMTAMGHSEFIAPAQGYIDDANSEEILDILDAMAFNPDSDAAITLRTHMRDARSSVRRRAIVLYGQREDARAEHLISAMRHDDYEAQTQIVSILTERFGDQWREHLEERLNSDAETIATTLRMLQVLLRTEEEMATLKPLQNRLAQLATDDQLQTSADGEIEDDEGQDIATAQSETIANLAAYVLFRISDEGEFQEVLAQNQDPQTRAAYLEYLVTNDPRQHVDVFRDYLYDDLYVLRLLAATGLWSAYSESATWPVQQAADDVSN